MRIIEDLSYIRRNKFSALFERRSINGIVSNAGATGEVGMSTVRRMPSIAEVVSNVK